MSKLCERLLLFCNRNGRNDETTENSDSLYKRIRNVYGLRCDNLDDEDVIFLAPGNQDIRTDSSLEVREILKQKIIDIEEDLRSEPRSEDYIEQASNLIENYKHYIEISHAYDLSGNVLGTD